MVSAGSHLRGDVERFADGNGDGVGDFVGLTQRLPYLKELGVTCLWLLPFYPTPNRDNGYDVRDYYGPRAEAGGRQDFLNFVHAAGEYGMRVIVDLVVNHTSDKHPWCMACVRFPRSRRDVVPCVVAVPPVVVAVPLVFISGDTP